MINKNNSDWARFIASHNKYVTFINLVTDEVSKGFLTKDGVFAECLNYHIDSIKKLEELIQQYQYTNVYEPFDDFLEAAVSKGLTCHYERITLNHCIKKNLNPKHRYKPDNQRSSFWAWSYHIPLNIDGKHYNSLTEIKEKYNCDNLIDLEAIGLAIHLHF